MVTNLLLLVLRVLHKKALDIDITQRREIQLDQGPGGGDGPLKKIMTFLE